jgi:transposase
VELVHRICCGIDVGKREVVACLRRVLGMETSKEHRTFATTMTGLRELLSWLKAADCRLVAMESTGVYWRPVHNILRTECEVVLGNSRDIRQMPGRKTDKADAAWIAELLAHNLIAPSFVPPAEIAALRDLTRARASLVQTRTQAKNRVHKVLEDTNIKLASVATDIFGKSGRRMLEALGTGEQDPTTLASMALGRLKKKIPELELALEGNFTSHHAKLIKLALELIDQLNSQIATIDAEIYELTKKLNAEVVILASLPGVNRTSACAIIAEIGVDMKRFGSAERLSSWAGVCPGNNESAGKRKSGKTRKGSKWLRRVLTECAWAARKTKSHLGDRFRQLEKRIGGKKAAVAVAHQLLVIAWHCLHDGTFYEDERYGHITPKQEEQLRKKLVARLEQLGYAVNVTKLEMAS